MGMKKLKLWFQKKIHGYEMPDFKKARPLELKPDDRVLLLAPHPDDETIGCGGFLLKYGAQCDVVLLTDGRHGDSAVDPAEMAEIRKREFEDVMSRYAVKSVRMMNFEDGKVIDRFKDFSTLDFEKYDYVFMPHPMDMRRRFLSVQTAGAHASVRRTGRLLRNLEHFGGADALCRLFGRGRRKKKADQPVQISG